MKDVIKVVFFQRRPLPIHKSIEAIFDDVRSRMPSCVHCVTKVFSVYSQGLLPRLRIMYEAFRSQGDINHITGDIHFAAIWLRRSKTMLTVHDCGMLASSGLKYRLLKYFWFTLPLKRTALLTAVSEATRQEILKHVAYPPEKIHVIPVAISPGFRFVPKPFHRAKPVILQVGVTQNKNIPRLMEALRGIPCQLVIIGVLPQEIREQLNASGISYTNRFNLTQAELVEQYVQCDLLAFVSTYEGFGMPIVEANATGRPVITSNLLSMPEVAGGSACLIDPYDTQQIRDGLLKIIHDDGYRSILVEKGLENARRFDAQFIATRYLHLYKQLVSTSCAE